MTAYASDLTEEGRAFFQQRVALFAKVMIGAQALGMTGLIALSSWEQLWQPWFGLYQVQTGLVVVAWLLCRGGMRSVRFVSCVPRVANPTWLSFSTLASSRSWATKENPSSRMRAR